MPFLWALPLLLLASLYAQGDTSFTRVDFSALEPITDSVLSQPQAPVEPLGDSALSSTGLSLESSPTPLESLPSYKQLQKQTLDRKWKRSLALYWLGLGGTGSGIALQGIGLYKGEKEPLILGTALFLVSTPMMGRGNGGMREVQKARDPAVEEPVGWVWYGLSWLGVLGGGLLVLDGAESGDDEGDPIETGLGFFCIGTGVLFHYIAAASFAWDGFHAQIQGPHWRVSPVVSMASQGALAPGLELAMVW